MANKNLGIFILIATLVAQATWVRAAEHIVGEDKGWDLGVDYEAWSNSREFFQGDKLVFNYKVHLDFPVFYVTKERYECCCPMGSLMELANTGRNVVTLGGVGEYHFIPKGVDCVQGMKLRVNVKPRPALQEGRDAAYMKLFNNYIPHEESSSSFPKAKLPPPIKSIVKEYRSEKSLPGTRATANRSKQTIVTPSKPHTNQIAAGFNFKSDQRAERRKEEKRAAAEMTQSRKSLNFKATPVPSFYKESARSLDQNKAIQSSKTTNRPRTASMAPSTKRVPSNSASSSNPRPSSSTSVSSRYRLPEPSRKVQEKKKDLNLQKQKGHEAIIGARVRDTKRDHTGTGLKPGYLVVRVST